jgi:hypothetical protein
VSEINNRTLKIDSLLHYIPVFGSEESPSLLKIEIQDILQVEVYRALTDRALKTTSLLFRYLVASVNMTEARQPPIWLFR